MQNSSLHRILSKKYPEELVDGLLACYSNAISEFRKENWKYFGDEIGQFIEYARRIIEFQFQNDCTQVGSALPSFNEQLLMNLAQADSSQNESYRIIIPRVLFAMNTIRNKRGTIHVSYISPNKIDASLQLGSMKWILAELIRLNSDTSSTEAEELINSIVQKEDVLLWEVNNKTRILNSKLSSKDQVLLLLYKHNSLPISKLLEFTEYKNKSRFVANIKSMHDARLLELSDEDICTISPSGLHYIEELLHAKRQKARPKSVEKSLLNK